MTARIEDPAIGPVAIPERIGAVDIVRGFALWGVLLVHMWSYTWGPFPHFHPVDQFTESALVFLFREKSWHLLFLLFGFGFALQMVRAGEHGARFLPTYVRRLAVLLGFGFVNYLFFWGDVLTSYAILGFVLLLFRRWSPRWLLATTVLLLLVAPVNRAIRSMVPTDPELAAQVARASNLAEFDQAQELARVRMTGSLADNWGVQARTFVRHVDPRPQLNVTADGWLARFAMLLLGLYAGKRRIFQEFERHRVLIRRIFFWGLPLGLLAMTADWIFDNLVTATRSPALELARGGLWSYGTTVLALSYAAGFVLLARQTQWRRILSPLGAMGRMALTVYLSQSIIHTTIFFGYGFGRWGHAGTTELWGYAALIFAAQMAICVWWMKRFRFGPAEWLWRTLTYLQLQPMRLPRTETTGAKAAAEGA